MPLGLTATLYERSRDPVPLLDETDSQDALEDAVQAQPDVALSCTVLVDAPACTVRLVGESEKLQVLALWLTVTVRPATVSVPLRAAPWFGAIVKFTLPLPVRLAPEVIVIHELLLTAVQAQPDVVETAVELLPPPPAMFRAVGETV